MQENKSPYENSEALYQRPGSVQVNFDGHGRSVTWTAADLGVLSPARARTVHKAQGAAYPVVVAVLASSHQIMLANAPG